MTHGEHEMARDGHVTASALPIERFIIMANAMHFDALGAGPRDGPLVLCLHGFPEFADAWIPIMGRLAAGGFRVVAIDQRGYSAGARPPKVSDYAVSHLTADVLAVADALGARTFHVVGHDWGGIVAWTLGAEHSDRLLSLSVLSTPHSDALRAALRSDWDQKRRSWYVALFRLPAPITERMLLAFRAKPLRDAFQGKVPAEQVGSNIRRLREPGALTAALNWYRALELGGRTGTVRAPTMFVWGSRDQALGRTAAEATAAYVSGTYRFEVLPGASHWLLEEKVEAVSNLLLDHLPRAGGR